MIRYILRRTLQMIPTVLGVIIITFILFNVVGGSPASMTLGKHVSPKALEDFDEVRGFNKPLLLGAWTGTRALADADFKANAGAWGSVEGVEYKGQDDDGPGRIRVLAKKLIEVPVAFSLRPSTSYRIKLKTRTTAGQTVRLYRGVPAADDEETLPDIQLGEIPGSGDWRSDTLTFTTPEEGGPYVYRLLAGEAPVEVRDVRFRRKVANPFDSQFIFYLRQVARLDFGVSNSTNQRVSKMLRDGIIPSLTLTVPIFLVQLVVSVSLSLICAFFRDRFIDRFFVVISVALMSVNYIVWIILGQYLLGFHLGWFPVWGYESWSYLSLPVLIGVISGLGGGMRLYRTIMLDEMYKDYVRTGFAKGLSGPAVLFRHVLKNAMIPIVTNVVIAIPFLYTGSLLLESFFGIPGLGYMGINAINSSDVDVVRAIVLIGAVLFVIANLMTDICYAWLDPRVKLK